MYKCAKCGKSSNLGESRLTVIKSELKWDEKQKKQLMQIKSETPVCRSCKEKSENVNS